MKTVPLMGIPVRPPQTCRHFDRSFLRPARYSLRRSKSARHFQNHLVYRALRERLCKSRYPESASSQSPYSDQLLLRAASISRRTQQDLQEDLPGTPPAQIAGRKSPIPALVAKYPAPDLSLYWREFASTPAGFDDCDSRDHKTDRNHHAHFDHRKAARLVPTSARIQSCIQLAHAHTLGSPVHETPGGRALQSAVEVHSEGQPQKRANAANAAGCGHEQ